MISLKMRRAKREKAESSGDHTAQEGLSLRDFVCFLQLEWLMWKGLVLTLMVPHVKLCRLGMLFGE